jgi:hypothetical protein
VHCAETEVLQVVGHFGGEHFVHPIKITGITEMPMQGDQLVYRQSVLNRDRHLISITASLGRAGCDLHRHASYDHVAPDDHTDCTLMPRSERC